jgi:hypothetical protein
MTIKTHLIQNNRIAEIESNKILVNSIEEALQLLVDVYYQDFDKIILFEHQITPDFFELKNGMAGEILQKFSNYRVKLAIVGDFSNYKKESILQFMAESNRMKQINFVKSLEDAFDVLCAG